jgi:hypothetical protein
MAPQSSSVDPKLSRDICRKTTFPVLLMQDCTNALHELGRFEGPSKKDVRSTLVHRSRIRGLIKQESVARSL